MKQVILGTWCGVLGVIGFLLIIYSFGGHVVLK